MGDKYGNVVAYDPVLGNDVFALLSTGFEIQSLVADDDYLFVSSYDEQLDKSYIDQYPIFINRTASGLPDFQIFP